MLFEIKIKQFILRYIDKSMQNKHNNIYIMTEFYKKSQNKKEKNMFKRKKAFTFAEVLITLGIIGVVAAMIIPTLIANIKGARIRSQFKKGISTLNQAVRLNLANYDWDFGDIHDTNHVKSKCASANPESEQSICALLNASLTGKTLLVDGSPADFYEKELSEIINSSVMNMTSTRAWLIYQLSDNNTIGIHGFTARCTEANGNCVGFIDINGKQGPNKEIECLDTNKTKPIWDNNYEECIVKITGNTGDILPIAFYNSTVVPATNASKYILDTAK